MAASLCCSPHAAWGKLPTETATVVRTYPHDRRSFTEGLLVHEHQIYESTGYVGRSVIKRYDLASGRLLAIAKLPPDLFGEGIVDYDGRIYSIVWRGGNGFTWDDRDLRRLGQWRYSGEGWGLTRIGRQIVMSDGTSTLRFLQPAKMKTIRRLAVTAEGKPVQGLNELEFVHGEILANVWPGAMIARIDPEDGRVKGWIDIRPLWRQAGTNDEDAIPNGIAYDAVSDRLYVTGKDWPVLFEIRPPARQHPPK